MKNYLAIKKMTNDEIKQELINTEKYTEDELQEKNRDELLLIAQKTRPDENNEHWIPKYGEIFGFALLIITIIQLFRKEWGEAIIIFLIAVILYVVSFLIHQKIINSKLKK